MKESHKNAKRMIASLVSFIFLIVISFSFISAESYLEGNKSVSPNVLYVGDNTTITLTVSGAGNASNVSLPLDIILVVDNSCSMQGTKISDAKASAIALVDSLNSALDKVGLVSFNTNPTIRNSLTSNYGSVRANINALTVCGNTNVGEAIKKASEQFGTTTNSKSIVLISDGNTNLPANARAYALQQAAVASAKNITIYSIGIGSDVNSNILRDIATAGNGLYFHYPSVSDPHTINNVAQWILNDAHNVQSNSLAGKNVIVTDILAQGVFPISMPSACSYEWASRKVSCNASILNINDSASFNIIVSVYNSSLTHLNEIAYVNYTNYLNNNVSFILNNPNVTILPNNTCTNCICYGNVAPQIVILSPSAGIYNNTLISVNINATDSNLSRVWYNLNGTNVSYSSPLIVNLSNGTYRLTAYANDSCGSLSSIFVDFTVNTSANQNITNTTDNIGPNVTIVNPLDRTYNTGSIRLNITAVDDLAVDDIWFTLNGARYDYSSSFMMNLSEGNYTLIAYANDTSGNLGFDSVNFRVLFDEDNTCNGCGGSNTHAPVNDFDDSELAGSISMDDDSIIALNNVNSSIVNEGFDLESYVSGEMNRLIFNMILLIAIIVLLLLIVLLVRKKN